MDRIYRLTEKTRDTPAGPSKPAARGDILPGTSRVGCPFSALPCAPGGCMEGVGDGNLLHPAEAAPSPGSSRKPTSRIHWWECKGQPLLVSFLQN